MHIAAIPAEIFSSHVEHRVFAVFLALFQVRMHSGWTQDGLRMHSGWTQDGLRMHSGWTQDGLRMDSGCTQESPPPSGLCIGDCPLPATAASLEQGARSREYRSDLESRNTRLNHEIHEPHESNGRSHRWNTDGTRRISVFNLCSIRGHFGFRVFRVFRGCLANGLFIPHLSSLIPHLRFLRNPLQPGRRRPTCYHQITSLYIYYAHRGMRKDEKSLRSGRGLVVSPFPTRTKKYFRPVCRTAQNCHVFKIGLGFGGVCNSPAGAGGGRWSPGFSRLGQVPNPSTPP